MPLMAALSRMFWPDVVYEAKLSDNVNDILCHEISHKSQKQTYIVPEIKQHLEKKTLNQSD